MDKQEKIDLLCNNVTGEQITANEDGKLSVKQFSRKITAAECNKTIMMNTGAWMGICVVALILLFIVGCLIDGFDGIEWEIM